MFPIPRSTPLRVVSDIAWKPSLTAPLPGALGATGSFPYGPARLIWTVVGHGLVDRGLACS
jgi:hypothetical protein